MASEDPAVGVHFVDHDVPQVLEELHPLGVVRQDAAVEHVGVGHHQMAARADGFARVLRCVSVVGERPDVGADVGNQRVQLRELILGQRLGREEIERAGLGLPQHPIEHWQVVAEGLSRGGRSDHDRVFPLANRFEGLALMGVQPLDPAAEERLAYRRRKILGEIDEVRGLRGKVPKGGDALESCRFAFELRNHVLEGAASIDRRQDLRHGTGASLSESRRERQDERASTPGLNSALEGFKLLDPVHF